VKVKIMTFKIDQAVASPQILTHKAREKGCSHRVSAKVWAAVALSTMVLASSAALAQKGPSKSEYGASKSGVPSSFGPAPQLSVGSNEQSLARRIDLSIGKSIIVDLPREAKEIFVANPKVANAIVRSSTKLFIIGIADGFTTIFALDDNGRQIAALEIAVGRDLNVLRTMLRGAVAGTNIDIKPAGDSILLTGQVGSLAEAQQAVDIANAFVGVSGGAFSSTRGAVVNGMTVKGRDQVMVKVTVAEVSRAVLKQLGITTTGSWASLAGSSSTPFSLATQTLAATTLSAVVKRGSNTTDMTLRAFERNGLSRTLAEPVLTAISGESAKFTAGGEIPIPKSTSCSTDTLGRRQCEVGIEFKPFGVSLNITPLVLAENRISLKVSTEVTELDSENQVRFDTINVVGTKVRKSDTTVELPSGGSMMTAGLIQQASRQVINGFPGLMNLPVLGALFRSRDYQRQETELVIIVTPIIAKPIAPSETARPDDGYADANDGQTILLGRLHKIYGVAGAPTEGIAMKGRYGFIND
jgi:pilus assembly protein CpaC